MTNPPEDNLPAPIIASGGVSDGSQQETASVEPQSDVPAAFGIDPAASAPGPLAETSDSQPNVDRPLFYAYTQSAVRRPVRIPHFGHLLIVSLLIAVAAAIVGLGIAIASQLGWKIPAAATADLQFNLLSEGAIYLIAFVLSLIVFPLVWNEGYFAGLQWRSIMVRSRFWILAGISLACFVLAFLDQVLLPGPPNAPIEKMMSSPSAAWLMFGFGVTLAPFFEEMYFRGFMLPAMCTVADWTEESLFARPELKISEQTRVALSIPAMLLVCGVSVGVPSAIGYVAYQGLTSTGHHRAAIFSIAVIVGAGIYCGLRSMRSSTADQHIKLDAAGHPHWSMPAMIVGSIATTIPFALLHVEQQGHSLGPFLDILAVSLILCAVRLLTRSLAASTIVHAVYNFFIFTIELIGTGGFRHFDRM